MISLGRLKVKQSGLIVLVFANKVKQSRMVHLVIANKVKQSRIAWGTELLHFVRNDGTVIIRMENPYSDKVPLVAQTTQHIFALIPLLRGVTFIK
ncbi:MAG: hypothetical protein LBB84_07375 [Tannerellaceae bacterium]|jgi:hypothetical protein|nr:hypothetical protein [Tannerellaceae bacterium]